MKILKNIETLAPLKIASLITNSEHTIASKAICNTEHTDVRFFSYAKDESISKEIQEEDSIIYVFEGSLKLQYGKDGESVVNEGELIVIPSGLEYGLYVLEDSKSLNILVK